MEAQNDYIRKRALVAVLIVVSLIFLWMLRDFLMTLLLAGIFSRMLQPLYGWLLRRMKGRTLWASISTLVIFVGAVGLPALLLMLLVGAQAVDLSESVAPTISSLVENPEEANAYLEKLPFYEELAPYQGEVIQKAGEVAKELGSVVFKGLSGATKGTLLFFFHAFIMLYAMFYFLVDGEKVVRRILLYLPLPAEDEDRILERFVSVSRATIKGTFIIGALQGGLAGIALGVGGVPNWVFWGAVMAVLSVIPGIGAALVWVPACAYLALTGHPWSALWVALFCAVVVGSADNVLRPKLVGEDAKMSDIMILLSTLGGLTMFGAPGVIVGPIVAALFVTLWEIYGEVFAQVLPPVGDLDPTSSSSSSSSSTSTTPEDPWADEAEGWDEDPVVVAYADAAFESLSAVPIPADARVLDFGCGTGLLTERLAPRVQEVVAVDASPAMIEVLTAKDLDRVRAGVARWTPETIDEDPLAEGPFDLVVCSSVCAFLDDYPGTVAMLAARLRPGGHFVQWDWELDPSAEEPFGLSAEAITAALSGAGLEVVRVGVGFDVPIEGERMRPLMGVGRRPA